MQERRNWGKEAKRRWKAKSEPKGGATLEIDLKRTQLPAFNGFIMASLGAPP